MSDFAPFNRPQFMYASRSVGLLCSRQIDGPTWQRPVLAQTGGPGMSALTPVLGVKQTCAPKGRFAFITRAMAHRRIMRTRPSRAPLIWTRYTPASAALNPSMGQVYFHIATASIIAIALAN